MKTDSFEADLRQALARRAAEVPGKPLSGCSTGTSGPAPTGGRGWRAQGSWVRPPPPRPSG